MAYYDAIPDRDRRTGFALAAALLLLAAVDREDPSQPIRRLRRALTAPSRRPVSWSRFLVPCRSSLKLILPASPWPRFSALSPSPEPTSGDGRLQLHVQYGGRQ